MDESKEKEDQPPHLGSNQEHGNIQKEVPFSNENDGVIILEETTSEAELTFNNHPLNKQMEIHQHPHVHEEKKWREYLFQFLMLFLAVFCGFLAEYQLEHLIEHQREKQFMESLTKDVQADINKLDNIISHRNVRERRLDSLSFFMNTDSRNIPTSTIYAHAVTASRSLLFRFIANDGTLQQLKNSGALRLIRNRAVADSIGRYDVSIRNFIRQGELEEMMIQDYRTASSSIFDALVFDKMLDGDNNVLQNIENDPL